MKTGWSHPSSPTQPPSQAATYNDDPYGIAAFAAQQAQAELGVAAAASAAAPTCSGHPRPGSHPHIAAAISEPMDQSDDGLPAVDKRPLGDAEEADEDDPPQKQGRTTPATLSLPGTRRSSRDP